jgi:cation diffusion facilitator family transporter
VTALDARRAAALALAVTFVLTVAKLAVWAATSSLAVLSQAVDSAVDIVALALLLLAVRISAKPADDEHHYGHHKAENLAAFTQTAVIALVVVGVAVQAIVRLVSGSSAPRAPWYALALLAVSALVDVVRVRMLMSAARAETSEALRAGALNLATDAGTALVALVSLALVRFGWEQADALGALVVAAAALVAAWRLGARSVGVLMDRVPSTQADEIVAAAGAVPGVAEARRVRIRGDGKQVFADVTVTAERTASLERAHDIAEEVEQEIERVAPGVDVVVHVEPAKRAGDLVERVQAAATKAEEVREVHNVSVQTVHEGGRDRLHVTLHAKVGGDISLIEAHALSERIESSVVAELGPDARVDTHLEPLERPAPARDVSEARSDIVGLVTRLAEREPEVLDCHEVLVTSSGAKLTVVAHVRARSDLPLDRIHRASERIERAVGEASPEVGAVVIHFEPE